MSIKITIAAGALKTEALLKDAAYGELMQFVFRHQDGAAEPQQDAKQPPAHAISQGDLSKRESSLDATCKWLAQHTASEVLNRIGWKTNPEKILLLGAFHEANGGEPGWRSAEMTERFNQAREDFPKNFSRDIGIAVEGGLIGAVTARSYKVGRVGWNKIADAIADLEFPTK